MAAQETLIMLHGLLGTKADFNQRILPANWSCFAPDLPGHGENHALRLPLDDGFTAFADWLALQLTEHGIHHYWLYGYSLGGRLAIDFASRWPTGLKGLIVESCHPGLRSKELQQARQRNDQEWADRFRTQAMADVLQRWYRQPVFSDLADDERSRLVEDRSVNQGADVAAMLEATSLGRQRNLWPWLQEPPCPVHYLVPGRDSKFSQLAEQLAHECPHLQFHHFANAGHNIHRAVPEQWQQTLNQILIKSL